MATLWHYPRLTLHYSLFLHAMVTNMKKDVIELSWMITVQYSLVCRCIDPQGLPVLTGIRRVHTDRLRPRNLNWLSTVARDTSDYRRLVRGAGGAGKLWETGVSRMGKSWSATHIITRLNLGFEPHSRSSNLQRTQKSESSVGLPRHCYRPPKKVAQRNLTRFFIYAAASLGRWS
ncbi:hypothetical protein B0O99DRAFT_611485 [Bisporella sp. PMI_857]|nr:hypothetical protein B0O99DRAFT_611485 [Bisporella sp. PMI_857]